MKKSMKVYNYNIRCRICKKGFNPKTKQNAYNNICPDCYKLKAKTVDKSGSEKNTYY